MGGNPMAFLFGHGEPFIMAFFLPGRIFIIYCTRTQLIPGREEDSMKKEHPKSVTPIPWDNMPRKADAPANHPQFRSPRGAGPDAVAPVFSSVHAFFPFQATPFQSKEEK
jgi:hypothetical protein